MKVHLTPNFHFRLIKYLVSTISELYYPLCIIHSRYQQSIGAPRSGARSERHSGKLARSAIGAPLRNQAGAHLERQRSDCAPTNSEIHRVQ